MVYRLMKNNRVFFDTFSDSSNEFDSNNLNQRWTQIVRTVSLTGIPMLTAFWILIIFFFKQTERKAHALSSQSLFKFYWKINEKANRENISMCKFFFLLLVFLMRIVNRNFTLKMNFFWNFFTYRTAKLLYEGANEDTPNEWKCMCVSDKKKLREVTIHFWASVSIYLDTFLWQCLSKYWQPTNRICTTYRSSVCVSLCAMCMCMSVYEWVCMTQPCIKHYVRCVRMVTTYDLFTPESTVYTIFVLKKFDACESNQKSNERNVFILFENHG